MWEFWSLGCRKYVEVFQEVVKNWVIGSRWRRSCSVTQEVVTGDTPAPLPLPSFSTSGPCLAFSFSQHTLRPFPFFVLPLSSTMFALTPGMWHMLRSYEHTGLSKTLISGLKGDQSWTGVCCLIDNLQLLSFMFPSLSTAYSTYAFSPFLSYVPSPAKLLPCVYFEGSARFFLRCLIS